MRYSKCFVLIFLLFSVDAAFSQAILKRAKQYVIIDIDETYGLKVNDQVTVQKNFAAGKTQNTGTLKIVLFKSGKCIGQIISENPDSPIAIGDFISTENNYSTTQSKYSSVGPTPSSSGGNSLTYLSLGVGIIASGIGYYFLDQANQTYKDYEAATTSSAAVDLFGKTEELDKKSKIGFGVGGGLIAVGLISYLMNHNNPQPKSGNTFSLQPLWKNSAVGLGLRLSFNHPSRK